MRGFFLWEKGGEIFRQTNYPFPKTKAENLALKGGVMVIFISIKLKELFNNANGAGCLCAWTRSIQTAFQRGAWEREQAAALLEIKYSAKYMDGWPHRTKNLCQWIKSHTE
jgi:hypothetical protein